MPTQLNDLKRGGWSVDKVHQYIVENQDKYLEWLKLVCDQPSVSAQNRGMEKMFQLLIKLFKDVGAETSTIQTDGYPVLIAKFPGEKDQQLAFYNPIRLKRMRFYGKVAYESITTKDCMLV